MVIKIWGLFDLGRNGICDWMGIHHHGMSIFHIDMKLVKHVKKFLACIDESSFCDDKLAWWRSLMLMKYLVLVTKSPENSIWMTVIRYYYHKGTAIKVQSLYHKGIRVGSFFRGAVSSMEKSGFFRPGRNMFLPFLPMLLEETYLFQFSLNFWIFLIDDKE